MRKSWLVVVGWLPGTVNAPSRMDCALKSGSGKFHAYVYFCYNKNVFHVNYNTLPLRQTFLGKYLDYNIIKHPWLNVLKNTLLLAQSVGHLSGCAL